MEARSPTIANLLCEAGADVDAASLNGETALMRAAQRGFPAMVQFLLEKNADVNAAKDLGETAIYFAALAPEQENRKACLSALLNAGANVDEETNKGITPLMAATMAGHVNTIDFLISCGANVDARTVSGKTALILGSDGRNEWTRDFSFNSRMEESIPLLASAGADLNAADNEGYTALHGATRGFDAGCVKLLLELGARGRSLA